MPPPIDAADPLRRAIADYAALNTVQFAAGRFALSSGDPLSMICREIEQTRLSRRLILFVDDAAHLEIDVRNGRVVSMHQSDAAAGPFVFLSGGPEEAAHLVSALAPALKAGVSLSVEIRRDIHDVDPTATGVAASAMKAAAKGSKSLIPSQTTFVVSGLSKEMEASDIDFERWIEEVNDQTFDEITFQSDLGQTLTLSFTPDGARASPNVKR